MTTKTLATALALLACAGFAPAHATPRHRAPDAVAPNAVSTQQGRSAFYPDRVEGGVPGNLSFNNQIRKHTDGLNANGSGR